MTTVAPTKVIRYEPYGGAETAFLSRNLEIGLDGPAGTGKTLAALNKIHLAMHKYAGARGLLARKTNTSLAGSALVTFREDILDPDEGVRYFGGSKDRPAAYIYPNGSQLVINGLDAPEKVKSTAFDIALINEATECTLEDINFVRSRLRHNKMPYQQLIMDMNPGAPSHWLNQRMNPPSEVYDPTRYRTQRIISRHEDNPRYWDRVKQEWTPEGRKYIFEILEGLTGVYYDRLRLGKWVAAEGGIYKDVWDAAIHLINRFPIPREWARFIDVDFGFRNPAVVQWWAKNPDGALFMYREIYMTGRTIEDISKQTKVIHEREKEPLPYQVITDHDAGERAIFERYTGWYTVAAIKDVPAGINAVAQRMKDHRIFLLRDSLVERDPRLAEARLPTCTAEEVEGYCWDANKERPIKEKDHGLDGMRYQVAYHDLQPGDVTYGPKIF